MYFVKSLETGLSGNDSSSSLSGGSDDMTTNMTKERSKQSKATDLLAPNDGSGRAVSYHDGGIGLHRCRIGNARGTHSDSEMPEEESESETSSEEEIGAVLS